jgi:glycosidase
MAKNTDTSLQKQVIYSIYVRSHTPEGTFLSIIPDLDRIRALGCDIIWFMPIHPVGEVGKKGSLGCPYANRDYRTTNPEYGTMEDFQKLVDEIHVRGMKCMIDVVYNHTSPDSTLVAEHPEFFYRDAEGKFGNKLGDWTDVIDLDYSNRELWDYQIESLVMWAHIVDGFRCDVAPFVPLEFWKKARVAVAEVKQDFIWLAESAYVGFAAFARSKGICCAFDYEMYEVFDLEYEYDIRDIFEKYLKGEATLSHYLDFVNYQENAFPANYNKMRFLENHDIPRIASLITDEQDLINHTAFLYFMKGTTLIYAGQEFENTHCPSLFERELINYDTGRDLTSLMQRLYSIKQNLLGEDDRIHATADDANHIAYVERENADGKKVGIFSLKSKAGDVKVTLPDGRYTNQVDGSEITVKNGVVHCEGKPIIFTA